METLTYTVNIIDVFNASEEELSDFFADTPYVLETNQSRQQVAILWHVDGRNRILLTFGNVVTKTPSGYVRKFINREAVNRMFGSPEGAA